MPRARPRHGRHRGHGRRTWPASVVTVDQVRRQGQGVRGRGGASPCVDLIAEGTIVFVVNTPRGRGGRSDGEHIRKASEPASGQLGDHGAAALSAARASAHGGQPSECAQPPGVPCRRWCRAPVAESGGAGRTGCAGANVGARWGRSVAAEPGDDRRRARPGYGAELAPYLRPGALGAVVPQVARRLPVGRQPGAAGARHAGSGCSTPSACRARAWRRG